MIEHEPARWLNIVTAAPPAVTCPADLADIAGCADMIELRIDLLPIESTEDLEEWIGASPRPVLATLRTESQGGRFAGTPEELDLWRSAALDADAELIDVEVTDAQCAKPHPYAMNEVSSLHLRLDSGDLPHLMPYARKVAIRADGAQTFLMTCALGRERGGLFPYGAYGAFRTAFLQGNGREGFLFGSPEGVGPAVAGQPPLRAALDELRAGEVDTRAGRYALVGEPPAWSPSPAMHNAVFRAAWRAALYVPLPGVDIREAAQVLKGMSVTAPHKRTAFDMADEHDAWARRSGSVNTLVRRDDGSLLGLDTDARGIAALLGEPQPDRRGAYVYGAGGYARCAIAAMRAAGFEVRVGARDPEKGAALAVELDIPFAGIAFTRYDGDAILFNATPAGAVDDRVPVAPGTTLEDMVVFDAAYRDGGEVTALVRRAEADDAAQIVDGRALLLEQAVRQATAFGSRLDEDTHRRIMQLALTPPANVWLVGLRGSGKSTVGRALARRLGRPFADMDAEIERFTGRRIADLVADEGWAAFRRVEAEMFERLRHRRGVVIATGGGAVTTEATAHALEAAPHVVYLHVDAATATARVAASDAERPVLPGVEAGDDESRSTYGVRDPIYRRISDHVVDAALDVETVVREVARCWVGA